RRYDGLVLRSIEREGRNNDQRSTGKCGDRTARERPDDELSAAAHYVLVILDDIERIVTGSTHHQGQSGATMHLRCFKYPEAQRFRLPADRCRFERQQNSDVRPRQLLSDSGIVLLREGWLISQAVEGEV